MDENGSRNEKPSKEKVLPSSESSYEWPPRPQGSDRYPFESVLPLPLPQPSYAYMSEQHYPPLIEFDDDSGADRRTKLERMYSRIKDSFSSLEQVTETLLLAGLESSNLIVGIDFTKSNEWTGASSFNRRSLHHTGAELNPYEQAITIIGKTLSAIDEDNMIPCFGFGDASTHDLDVFSFYPDDRYCNGFEEVLSRYKELLPHIRLAGPTSFAPIIEMATTIVEQSNGEYHVLLIIADGQVTRSVDTGFGQLSPLEQETVNAIVEASKFPLSIILVGVGDGPWDTMKEFDDNIPARAFHNLQFVNFTEIMSKNENPSRKEAEFALAALMEIPSQYKATIELGLLGRKGNASERFPLPPPVYSEPSFGNPIASDSTSFGPSTPLSTHESYAPSFDQKTPLSASEPAPSFDFDNQLCPICISDPKNMAFGCGHQTCCDCGKDLQSCPICRSPISIRIKLY